MTAASWSQSSVDRIAGGGVRAEVDWVRVEQKG
jgi:hypothetical protein